MSVVERMLRSNPAFAAQPDRVGNSAQGFGIGSWLQEQYRRKDEIFTGREIGEELGKERKRTVKFAMSWIEFHDVDK